MRKLFLTLAILLLIAVIATPSAMAIGTASGTAITNQAFGDYQDRPDGRKRLFHGERHQGLS